MVIPNRSTSNRYSIWILVFITMFILSKLNSPRQSVVDDSHQHQEKSSVHLIAKKNRSGGCVENTNNFADNESILKKALSQIEKLKTRIHSKAEIKSFAYHFDVDVDTINQHASKQRIELNRTYEELLRKLGEGEYVYCADMFARKLDIPWNENQKRREVKFQQVLRRALLDAKKKKVTEFMEGNSGAYKDQLRLYYEIVQHDFVRTVCETGFNAGHSTFMWLNSNPDLLVYSFDLGEHEYARPMAEFLQVMFPGRLNITLGDSRNTLPTFREAHPRIVCDLIVIDGGHAGNVPQMDCNNLYQMVDFPSEHLVILDDWPNAYVAALDVGTMWLTTVQNGRAKTVRQCINSGPGKGLTIGIFI